MFFLISLTTPFQDPILSITLIFLIILLSPLILRRLRIPGIIGMIIAGVLIGENGFNLIESNNLSLLSKIGLLYIMFLAGLEIDITEFKKNKIKSIVFGFFTFFIPLSLGYLLTRYYFDYEPLAALLLASMFSTHTLLAYPIISKQNLTKNEAVIVAIGGTLITDTAVLMLLSLITNMSGGGSIDSSFWLGMFSLFVVFIIVVLWIMPKIVRWIFKKFSFDGSIEYLFVLSILFISSLAAEFIGIESIIGAFLCGLALNRVIPFSSALMNRTVFIGNTLFIPFFLIDIGMKVNIQLVINNSEIWIFSLILILTALITKWLAAYITQKIYKYSVIERNLIFGLSSAHAAAILAVVVVGIRLGLLDDKVLNATVVLILITCFVSSFVTEIYGRKQAIKESKKTFEIQQKEQKIVVPISNPETINKLLGFAMLIYEKKSEFPIYPLSVVLESDDLNQKTNQTHINIKDSLDKATAMGIKLSVVNRVDLNIAGGIIRFAIENHCSQIILGWSYKQSGSLSLFGNIIDNVILKSSQTLFISKIVNPLRAYKRLVVVVPDKADLEEGFQSWIKSIYSLSSEISAKCLFLCSDISIEYIIQKTKKMGIKLNFDWKYFNDWKSIENVKKHLYINDLLFVVSARTHAISYQKYFDRIPTTLENEFVKYSHILIIPEQSLMEFATNQKLDGVYYSPIKENIERISIFKRFILKHFKYFKNRK